MIKWMRWINIIKGIKLIRVIRSARLRERLRILIMRRPRALTGVPRIDAAQTKTTPAETGRRGERLAAAHLLERGLRIVTLNRRIAGVEIDIVAADDARNEWVVVEVKTTTSGTPGERRVDRNRLRRLERAATTLGVDRAARIMIVAVSLRETPPEIRIFEE
jgi:putative endonuclease